MPPYVRAGALAAASPRCDRGEGSANAEVPRIPDAVLVVANRCAASVAPFVVVAAPPAAPRLAVDRIATCVCAIGECRDAFADAARSARTWAGAASRCAGAAACEVFACAARLECSERAATEPSACCVAAAGAWLTAARDEVAARAARVELERAWGALVVVVAEGADDSVASG